MGWRSEAELLLFPQEDLSFGFVYILLRILQAGLS